MAAPISVRRHSIKANGVFPDAPAVDWCTAACYLDERPVFTLDPAFHTGAYYVQEASSMFLEVLLKKAINNRRGLRVLDLCAAPGGKSTLISSLLDKESLLISNEVIRSRASILEENVSRWGYANNWVTSNDPRDLGKLSGYFDIVVVDAPCSGSGLWRKDPAALNEWSEDAVAMCGARQHRIIADIWPAIKSGGVLIYATCSYSQREDEAVLDWMANEFSVETLSADIEPAWQVMEVSTPQNNLKGYRFFPDRLKGEGFFIGAVRKTNEATLLKEKKNRTAVKREIQNAAKHLLNDEDIVYLPLKKDGYNAIYAWHERDIDVLKQHVYLRKTGLDAGTEIKGKWVPAHDIALSVNASDGLSAVDVDKHQALRFLKREEMGVENVPKSWCLIKYNGWGLGWVKGLGNRVNNYLPKHWRIRMNIDFDE